MKIGMEKQQDKERYTGLMLWQNKQHELLKIIFKQEIWLILVRGIEKGEGVGDKMTDENYIWATRTEQGYCLKDRLDFVGHERPLPPRGIEGDEIRQARYISFPETIGMIMGRTADFFGCKEEVKLVVDEDSQVPIPSEERRALEEVVSFMNTYVRVIQKKDKQMQEAMSWLEGDME